MTKMRGLRHLQRSPISRSSTSIGSLADMGLRERSDGDAACVRELDPALAGHPLPAPKGIVLEPTKASEARRGSGIESRRGSY